jgi:hypothetical protein
MTDDYPIADVPLGKSDSPALSEESSGVSVERADDSPPYVPPLIAASDKQLVSLLGDCKLRILSEAKGDFGTAMIDEYSATKHIVAAYSLESGILDTSEERVANFREFYAEYGILNLNSHYAVFEVGETFSGFIRTVKDYECFYDGLDIQFVRGGWSVIIDR